MSTGLTVCSNLGQTSNCHVKRMLFPYGHQLLEYHPRTHELKKFLEVIKICWPDCSSVRDLSIYFTRPWNRSEEPRTSFPLRWSTKTFFLPHPPFLSVTERAQTHAKCLLHSLIFLCHHCAIPISFFFNDNYFAPVNFLLPVLSCLLARSQHLVDDLPKQ